MVLSATGKKYKTKEGATALSKVIRAPQCEVFSEQRPEGAT